VFAEAKLGKSPFGVKADNLSAGFSIIKIEQNGDQTAHDMGVAIATKAQSFAFNLRDEPNLTDTARHFVGFIMFGIAQGGQAIAKLDDETIALFPIVK
tara:strand:- start:1547 stop:1840 length:294 start_codon:yes stop_codon:yes gene_type:complete